MHDAQTEEHPLIVEAGGISYVAAEDRHGDPINQFTIRCSPVLYLAPIFLGGAAIPKGLGLSGSLSAIIAANVLGGIAAGICAAMGPRRGMPQLVMGRGSFGYLGNFLPAIFATILFIGYFSVGTIVGAEPIASMTGLPYNPLVIVVGGTSILLAVYGYSLLHLTGRWVTNAGLILLLITTGFALYKGAGPQAAATLSGSEYWFAWLSFFALIFSFTVSWMLYASDYSRYLPEATPSLKVFGYAFSGLLIGSTWMMGLGALLATVGAGNPLHGLQETLPTLLLWVVLISLIITSITHNSINLYSCAMASLTWDLPLRRRWTVVVAGTGGTIAAVFLGGTNFMNNFGQFLTLMSYFMAPWLAIMLIDYFRRDPNEKPDAFYDRDGPFAGVMWQGMSSFLIGIVVSIPFMANDFYTGPIASGFGGADTSYFVSFLVAGAIYLAIRSPRRSTAAATLDGNPTRT